MITALKQMLPLIESWPLDDQHALLEAARSGPPSVSAADLAAIDRGLDDARQGRFASADAVKAVRAQIRGA